MSFKIKQGFKSLDSEDGLRASYPSAFTPTSPSTTLTGSQKMGSPQPTAQMGGRGSAFTPIAPKRSSLKASGSVNAVSRSDGRSSGSAMSSLTSVDSGVASVRSSVASSAASVGSSAQNSPAEEVFSSAGKQRLVRSKGVFEGELLL